MGLTQEKRKTGVTIRHVSTGGYLRRSDSDASGIVNQRLGPERYALDQGVPIAYAIFLTGDRSPEPKGVLVSDRASKP